MQACLYLPPATEAAAFGGHQSADRQHLVPNQPCCCAAAMLGRCPIYWMRIDPAADWLAPAIVQQLPHMWGHQLLRSREVRRVLDSQGLHQSYVQSTFCSRACLLVPSFGGTAAKANS